MKAITVKQPWATAIRAAAWTGVGKDVENRTKPDPWRSAIGQRIAIHAGLSWDRHAPTLQPPLLDLWEWDLRRNYPQHVDRYPTAALLTYTVPRFAHAVGVIVATALLEEVHTCDGSCSPWAVPNVFHLVLAQVHPTQPIPARGQQGLWTLNADQLAALHTPPTTPEAHT